jgi:hypothetical protein
MPFTSDHVWDYGNIARATCKRLDMPMPSERIQRIDDETRFLFAVEYLPNREVLVCRCSGEIIVNSLRNQDFSEVSKQALFICTFELMALETYFQVHGINDPLGRKAVQVECKMYDLRTGERFSELYDLLGVHAQLGVVQRELKLYLAHGYVPG